jgi:hypothetical protein
MTGPLSDDEWRAAEAVLSGAWGGTVRLRDARIAAGRPHVVRVTAGDGREAILKRSRDPGDSLWGGEPHGLATEWATLEVLSGGTAGPEPVAPRLLGGDADLGIVLIEALPADRDLATSLLGDDAERAAADLVAYATTLGRFHTEGAGAERALATARRRLGVPEGPSWWAQKVAARRDQFVGLLGRLGPLGRLGAGDGPAAGPGQPSRDEIDADLDAVVRTLDGGDHPGIVHGDPCPDNVLVVDGAVRLLDFERAGWGCTAMDAAYLLAPFPSCWCFAGPPPTVAEAAWDAYRRAAGVGGPGWDRDVAAALAAAPVAGAHHLATALGDDDTWGTTTLRPRLLAWTAAFPAAPGAAGFPHLAAAVAALHDHLADAWSATPAVAYPALPRPGATPVAVPDDWDDSA